MKVKVLGTSCTWFVRNNTSFVIDDDIVFDVPSGNYKLISDYTDTMKIRCVLISHFHADHFGDFRVIATEIMRNSERYGRKEKLRVYAPKGVIDRLIDCNKVFIGAADECEPQKYINKIDFIELEDGFEFQEKGYKIKAFKMEHGLPETYGFSFEDESGKVVAFSSDTAMCENLHLMLENADFAFVEMSATSPHKTHLSTVEVVELINKYQNTKIFPIHTSNKTQDFAVSNGLNYLNDGDELVL